MRRRKLQLEWRIERLQEERNELGRSPCWYCPYDCDGPECSDFITYDNEVKAIEGRISKLREQIPYVEEPLKKGA